MFLDDPSRPGPAILAHVARHPFVYLSLALHTVVMVALQGVHVAGNARVERARQQHLVEAGQRLTEQARLEKRVQDMARIKALLEESAAAGPARRAQAGAQDDAARPRPGHETPGKLLETATALARAIDGIERDIKAARLATLLAIPKEKALERLAQASPPPETARPAPRDAADAAARIAGLEARARAALEQRRRELERQRDGTPVTAGPARPAGMRPSEDGSLAPGDAALGAATGQGPATQGKTSGVALLSVLERITDFSHPDLPEQPTKAYAASGQYGLFDGGKGRIPAVGAGAVAKGSGGVIGPGGPYASRVFVDRWYLIGPFEGRHGAGLFANGRHPPEQAVVLDAAYRGKDGRLLRWEYVDAARYPLVPPVAEEDAVYYGYTELMMDEDRDLTIWVGADDDARLWLNDRLVWGGGNVDKGWFFGQAYDTWNTHVRDYNLSEGRRTVRFRKGRNKLFFKLSNGPTRVFFSLVLTT
ncbi:hypothetical protein [uncultured Massilia sp.]|uniref:hypothetical protein n=1 Tax=uncultured Massilia sp. TaxID=169973 RepID=UPI0025FB59F0|nr:hypothetical protein [uncultured Massilia sp.]